MIVTSTAFPTFGIFTNASPPANQTLLCCRVSDRDGRVPSWTVRKQQSPLLRVFVGSLNKALTKY